MYCGSGGCGAAKAAVSVCWLCAKGGGAGGAEGWR